MVRTLALVLLLGCSSPPRPATRPATPAATPAGDPEAVYGPLDVGADYATYQKLTSTPFLSQAHGSRWVDVYVNAIGAKAYLANTEIPVGTIVVKTSWVDQGGKPSTIAGPIFVMEKRAPGYLPDHGDWYYAIHWAAAPAKFGGAVFWRGHSTKVTYCHEGCHDYYDRGLGGLVPSSLVPR